MKALWRDEKNCGMRQQALNKHMGRGQPKWYMWRMDDHTLINGLLVKRQELSNLNAELRMANVANNIEAVERVLDGQTPRAARIVLFYRNELRKYLRAELQKSSEPLTGRGF